VNRKNWIPLLGIAFAVAVISTWIFYGLVAGRFEQAASATARTVVVARRPMEAGATVSADDLRSITWSGADAPDGAFALPSQVVGGRLLAPVGENEPLTRSAVEVAPDGGAASSVPVGMRAVSLLVGDSLGLMPMLGRGSSVDIQAVSTARDGVVSLHTILERVQVLNLQKPGEAGLGRNEPAVVTVLVNHVEADRLALADSAGQIRLALRNAAEGGNLPSPLTSTAAGIAQKTAAAAISIPALAESTVRIPIEVTLLAAVNAGDPGIRSGQAPALPVKGRWTGMINGGVALVDGNMNSYRVRVTLHGARFRNGRYEAVVEPEISWPGATATEARRLSQSVSWMPRDKVVVRGLSTPDGSPAVIVIAANGVKGSER
jgi:Flp pilus assembly protein CpaB